MEEKFDAFSELTELISQLEEQKKLIYVQLEQLVSQIISERITDQHEIEHVMDRLIDFGDDERFLALNKKLCRYVYNFYPTLVGEHVALFRLQFEEQNCEECEPPVQ